MGYQTELRAVGILQVKLWDIWRIKAMFHFRIIDTADGNQIIDRNLKTPYEALTPDQMVEYMEMDSRLTYMDRVERKVKAEAERKRRMARNPFLRLACLCGLA